MSYDLIKRLRDPSTSSEASTARNEAANRIEQLESHCVLYAKWDRARVDYINNMEEKLAKAVEALREIAGSVPYADNPWQIALAALAELE